MSFMYLINITGSSVAVKKHKSWQLELQAISLWNIMPFQAILEKFCF